MVVRRRENGEIRTNQCYATVEIGMRMTEDKYGENS